MGYKSEHLIQDVRERRQALRLSQRALSALTGQTQSHISQIESGKMEPGLSSFIDMARALGLEVMLVPKKFVPGVRGLIQSQTGRAVLRDALPEAAPAYALDDADESDDGTEWGTGRHA